MWRSVHTSMVHQCLPWYIVHAVCISVHCHYRLQRSFGICIQILFLNTKTDVQTWQKPAVSSIQEYCGGQMNGKKVVACAKSLCISTKVCRWASMSKLHIKHTRVVSIHNNTVNLVQAIWHTKHYTSGCLIDTIKLVYVIYVQNGYLMVCGARNALWNGYLAETWKPKATNKTHKEVMKVILTWQSVSYTATLLNVLPQTLPLDFYN